MRGKGITDVFLERTDALPVDRVIEGIPRIEVQHVRNRTLGCCTQHAIALHDPLLVMKEPRVQSPTDEVVSANLEHTRRAGDECDGIERLQNVSLVAKNGLGAHVTELMETCAPQQLRIDRVYRPDAIETPPYPMENFRLRQTMQRYAQSVLIRNPQEQCEIIGMEELPLGGGKLRKTLCR